MKKILSFFLVGALLFDAGLLLAQEQVQTRESLQKQEQVYGWQFMSEQERYEYQQQMRQRKTLEEQEAYRIQHHERMQERAQQQGLSLPDSPGTTGKGMGFGSNKKMKGGKR